MTRSGLRDEHFLPAQVQVDVGGAIRIPGADHLGIEFVVMPLGGSLGGRLMLVDVFSGKSGHDWFFAVDGGRPTSRENRGQVTGPGGQRVCFRTRAIMSMAWSAARIRRPMLMKPWI